MSYVDIFGGNTLSVAYQNYSELSLTSLNSPITLSWPLQFQTNQNIVSQIINLTATTSGLSVIMPDATLVSVGQAVLFVNIGANTITIYKDDGVTILTTIASGESQYSYLTDNTTINGTWTTVDFAAGVSDVTSIAAVSTSTDLVITGSPVTSAGTFTFSFANDIAALIGFGSGTGFAAHTALNTYALRNLAGTVNQIVVTNPAGVAGNPTFALASAISGINSLIASNIQIGVDGTNQISSADSNPIQFGNGASLITQKPLYFYDLDNSNYAAFTAPTNITTSLTYSLPSGPPPVSGYTLTSTTAGVMSWAPTNPGGVTSLIGTPDRITVSGATGAVTVDIAGTYVGQNTITTLGTVTTGTWNATPVTVPFGGTGDSSFVPYSVILGGTSSTSSLQSTATAGIAGQSLVSSGPAALATWATIPGKNIVVNGDFQIWQRGAGGTAIISVPATTTMGQYTADRWQLGTNANQACTVVQYSASGLPSGRFTTIVRRNAGETGTGSISFVTSLTRSMCAGAAGNKITLSFTAAKGVNFSAAGGLIIANVISGTGSTDISFFSGFTGETPVIDQNTVLTTGLMPYAYTSSTLPSNITQLAVQFIFTPTGTAGADDSFSITDVQLEISAVATPFDRRNFNEEIQLCQPFYEKSFNYSTAPANNVGLGNGEYSNSQTLGAATAGQLVGNIPYKTTKFKVPNLITVFNPAANNSEVRDTTLGADCSAVNTANNNQSSFNVLTTTAAGSAVADVLAIHWTADAELV